MSVSILRSIGAVIAGLVVAMILIIAVEGISAVFHPFPPDVDPADYEACKAHVANYPTWVLVVATLGWGATVFLSSWLATRLGTGRHPAHGIVVGSLLCLAAAANIVMLPYAVWFEVGCPVLLPLCYIAGAWLGKGSPIKAS